MFKRFGLALIAVAMIPVCYSHAGVISSNGVYTIDVLVPADGFSIGSWLATTGPSHPTGDGNALIYPFAASTSFSALRVYNPAAPTDYSYGGTGGGVNLDSFATGSGASPLGTGTRNTWSVTAESLDIVQDVIITPGAGATVGNSGIYHTVEITNTGNDSKNIGWRNSYDWGVNESGGSFDDGPNNSVENGAVTVVAPTTTEFSHTPAAGDIVRLTADPGVASYDALLGIGFDPGFFPALTPTVPDEYAYTSWAFGNAVPFDYVPSGLGVSFDSAGSSWFGRDIARSIGLAPGESVRLTQVLFGVIPDTPPPGIVPEPTSLAVWSLIGIAGLGIRRRRNS